MFIFLGQKRTKEIALENDVLSGKVGPPRCFQATTKHCRCQVDVFHRILSYTHVNLFIWFNIELLF